MVVCDLLVFLGGDVTTCYIIRFVSREEQQTLLTSLLDVII